MYANWGTRVGAYLIDMVALWAILLLSLPFADDNGNPSAISVVIILIGLAVAVYNRWYLTGKTGRSWGKKALGISLVAEATGQPIGVGKAFLRDIVHIVDGLPCYIGYLFPIWDEKRQTLADKILSTVVVKG
ncbi:RDD family protein [Micromonospora sp. NBC_01796]|uniref:RDD family protein n=1 Tax=Micromonospora sp. NBC_01796 TaxID=2975987 RepID=UPI002DD83E2A|nr:RDD family protein [Micromonospora sp. NBC_01796]WSA88348.1 RDD family protein [Micromonospora sp. NBC_01796]